MELEMVSNSKTPICDLDINTGRRTAISVDPDSKTPVIYIMDSKLFEAPQNHTLGGHLLEAGFCSKPLTCQLIKSLLQS